jgi:cell division protein FtsQ
MPSTTRAKPRPPIDPRIRERRIEVTRRQGRRRLRILLVVLGVLLVSSAAAAATRSSALDVDKVMISGARHTGVPDVLRSAGLDRHRLMVDVHADDMIRRLDQLPWVARANVQRDWPNTVRITVTERVPVASVTAKGGGWALADRSGRVLARQPGPAGDLPQITGGPPAGDPGSVVAPAVRDALATAAALPAALRPRAPVVAVGPEGVELRLTPKGVAKLGSIDRLDAKLDAVLTVLERGNVTNLVVLDVRVPSAPVLTRG